MISPQLKGGADVAPTVPPADSTAAESVHDGDRGNDTVAPRRGTALFLNGLLMGSRFNYPMIRWMRSGERLLETLADSLTGFGHVAEHAHRFDFYSYCEHYAGPRARLARELDALMKLHGSKLPIHGTVLGTAHRLFLDIRGALDSGVATMLDELIRGETFLASRTDAMLEQEGLPEPIYDVVRRIRANLSKSLLDLKAMRRQAGQGFAAGSFRLYR